MTLFKVSFTEDADADLRQISDLRTREVILTRTIQLQNEPLKQGKPLVGDLRGFRSVRAAGQRYRVVYQVAVSRGTVIVVVIGVRKSGSRQDVYVQAAKRLK